MKDTTKKVLKREAKILDILIAVVIVGAIVGTICVKVSEPKMVKFVPKLSNMVRWERQEPYSNLSESDMKNLDTLRAIRKNNPESIETLSDEELAYQLFLQNPHKYSSLRDNIKKLYAEKVFGEYEAPPFKRAKLVRQIGKIIRIAPLIILYPLYPLYLIIRLVVYLVKNSKQTKKIRATVTNKEFLVKLVLGLLAIYLILLILGKLFG